MQPGGSLSAAFSLELVWIFVLVIAVSWASAELSNTQPTCGPRGHFWRPAILFANFQI